MKKTLVCVIVYNRFENLKRWLECWELCDKHDAELLVVHNCDEYSEEAPFRNLCKSYGIDSMHRTNKGLDIGAFQVACSTFAFHEYENILWITDDTIPMRKDFVKCFTDPIKGEVGLTCMEISNIRSPLHVRTTGFCIKTETAQKLTFPNPLLTKEHCYEFEHRGDNTLMLQVQRMGLKCQQIEPLQTSPLWDTGNRAMLKRWDEHNKVFKTSKIIIMCPVYNTYPQIISSLICQTYQNWELYLVHDGPGEIIECNDKRVFFIQTENRVGNYGHLLRAEWLKKLHSKGDYIIISNADNYYMPIFLEKALETFQKNSSAVGVYCSQMVHSYVGFGVLNCRLARGFIDCGGVMLKANEAAAVGWNSQHHSSDWFFFNDIATKYGRDKFISFPGALFVHN